MEPQIIYEDEFIIGLDKPSGLLVHSDGRSNEENLVTWIKENRPEIAYVGEEERLQNGEVIKRPGIVHRLDRETSGIIIVAKTQKSFEFIKKQFQNRNTEKIYHALVWGTFSPDKMDGVIKKTIGRHAGDFRKWSAEHGAKGELREAVTEYKVLTQTNNPLNPPYIKGEAKNKNSVAYLEVRPKTGRTHQIRVHLKSISHPVVCDPLYSSYECDPKTCLGFSRLALHALSIKLQLPNLTFVKIEAELPKEFEIARKMLDKK